MIYGWCGRKSLICWNISHSCTKHGVISPPLVLKLGGSLFSCAREICSRLAGKEKPVLIVPGGGPFARAVREMGAVGTEAHWMAVSAMEQYGWYLSHFGLPVTADLAMPETPRVLLPYSILRARDPLPHSWDVTSDTIAAWCARELGVPLVLLKAVDGIRSGGILQDAILSPVRTDDVDPCFLGYVLGHGIPATVISGLHPERLDAVLDGMVTTGTTIGFFSVSG
jgi:hypothetical protein